MELLVLSDDFTGALDTGVQFAKQGVRTEVTSKQDLKKEDLDLEKATVLVINTESRHLSGSEARRKVESVVRSFVRLVKRRWGEEVLGNIKFYKKTDSLLRGNIGQELQALCDAVESSRLMFVPAFPQTGRTTIQGYQLVDGTPIHESSFAKDRLNPIPESYVPGILKRSNPELKTEIVELSAIRSGAFSLKGSLKGPSGSLDGGVTTYVFDAETVEDLESIGSMLEREKLIRITAGCAGFAGMLPQALKLPRHSIESAIYSLPLLVLCGSLTDLSQRQIEFGIAHGFHRTSLRIEEKLLPDLATSQRGLRIVENVIDRLRNRRNCIIATGTTSPSDEKAYAERNGLEAERIASLIAKNLAGLVAGILKSYALSTLVIFGGDTTMALLDALGIDFLKPLEEVIAGVPVSVPEKGDLYLITKSGGFGDEDVLGRILSRSRPAKI